jgi:DNA-binding response OmpR family regulator
MLPKLNGYKVCRLPKFYKKYKRISIIMFTACIQDSDIKLGKDVGVDAHVNKSLDALALMVKVRQLIGA